MSELDALVHELRMIAGDGSVEWLAGPISASVLREAADTIESLRDRLQELQGVMGTRYCELFGTPERASRTLYYNKEPICTGCALMDECKKIPDEEHDTCLLVDYDALLEWLRGDAE